MKINKHIYTHIQEKRITLPGIMDPFICYSIKFVSKYDYLLFGKVIKHKEKVEEVPFLFNSIEIVKDFCELKPIYKKIMRSNRINVDHVHYDTYALYNKKNEKIAELYWDKNFINVVHKSDGDVYYKPDIISTPLVESFAHELNIPSFRELQKFSDKRNAIGWVLCKYKKLSDLIRATLPIINDTENWHFELIENK